MIYVKKFNFLYISLYFITTAKFYIEYLFIFLYHNLFYYYCFSFHYFYF